MLENPRSWYVGLLFCQRSVDELLSAILAMQGEDRGLLLVNILNVNKE
jgi:hypothetical protein